MPKAMRIPMTYRPTHERLYWTVRKARFLSAHEREAWVFEDHDGYIRYGGRTWAELRDRFCLCADNHDMAHRLS